MCIFRHPSIESREPTIGDGWKPDNMYNVHTTLILTAIRGYGAKVKGQHHSAQRCMSPSKVCQADGEYVRSGEPWSVQ